MNFIVSQTINKMLRIEYRTKTFLDSLKKLTFPYELKEAAGKFALKVISIANQEDREPTK